MRYAHPPSFLVLAWFFAISPICHKNGSVDASMAKKEDKANNEPSKMSNTVDQSHRRLTVATGASKRDVNDFGQETYGVDVSFPIHRPFVSTNYDYLPHNVDPEKNPTVPEEYADMPVQPLGNRQQLYEELMEGCRNYYKKNPRACDETERDRIEMNFRQPQSMQNYTDMGFKKIKAPERVFKLIKEFWDKNHMKEKEEGWFTGNTYTNHWVNPTTMVSFEDRTLRGAGSSLKDEIWAAAKKTLEEWTGQELTPCSLYGIRIYKEGAVLATHVDRLPLVSSAIINVAQDLDEPWPVEVYGHDGKAYNVTMEPGDMVLYESHSILHGRPFPLKGRYYANVFIHFEPVGHSLRHGLKHDTDVKNQYREAVEAGNGGHENSHGGLPPYIIPGSLEENHWKEENPDGWEDYEGDEFATGSTAAHVAAAGGDLAKLKELAASNKDVLHAKDENGWKPIHEGARGGHVEVVRLLMEHGADINERANHGGGPTPLHIALDEYENEHPIISFFKSAGALDIGPDL